ncbi:MAG TPA: AI-2E family transporter, partial [Thermoanaerobaculia bacterium]|nr:AI-2E family transporter [Thermoanaerobaculia bacterium]
MEPVWRLKVEKWLIWIAFIGILVLLRHLFPVIFLTFVLTYIGNTLVNVMTRRWKLRRVNLGVVYVVFLLLLTGVGLLVVPRMFAEARQLAVFYISKQPAAANGETVLDQQTRKYVDSILISVVGPDTFRSYQQSDAYDALVGKVEQSIRNFVPGVVAAVREFANESIAILFQFLLSIILSFLILWDLPSLQRGVTALATGRTAEVYDEIAPSMRAFGVMLGRAFEAQTGIAVVNALLTSVGFLILGIPSIALLATIVFFCSYIPVVGVMLSTVPAALFAFKAGGIQLVFWLVVMVLIVHAIEAYALNPLIYGRHMKMHPVAILAILLIGEHLFGIWGLILGVPIAAFVWAYVLGGKTT